MNDKAFFDTNVLVYVVGQRDERTAAAEALVAGGGVVSVQALNELASVARRKLGMTWDEIVEALAAIRVLCPSPVALTIDQARPYFKFFPFREAIPARFLDERA